MTMDHFSEIMKQDLCMTHDSNVMPRKYNPRALTSSTSNDQTVKTLFRNTIPLENDEFISTCLWHKNIFQP